MKQVYSSQISWSQMAQAQFTLSSQQRPQPTVSPSEPSTRSNSKNSPRSQQKQIWIVKSQKSNEKAETFQKHHHHQQQQQQTVDRSEKNRNTQPSQSEIQRFVPSARENAEATKAMKSLSTSVESGGVLTFGELPTKKAVGKVGRQIKIQTNLFPLNFRPNVIYMYLVEFEPEISIENLLERRKFVGKFRNELLNISNQYVFDGIHFYSLNQISNSTFNDPNGLGSIILKFKKSIYTDDYESQEAFTVMNVMSKQFLRKLNLIQFGRSYYYSEPIKLSSRFGLNIYRGFQASVQMTQIGLSMLISLAHRVVHQKSFRDLIDDVKFEFIDKYGDNEETYKKIQKELDFRYQNNAFIAVHNKQTWRIATIDYFSTLDDTFQFRTSKISYRQYYKQTYNINLESNSYGMIVAIPKQKNGIIQKFPPEICYLTGMNDEMRSNFSIMKEFSGHTRMKASTRSSEIENLVQNILNNESIQKDSQSLPVQLQVDPRNTIGRVLGPFTISFQNKNITTGQGGSFMAERSGGFITSDNRNPVITKWAMLCESHRNQLRLANQFAETLHRLGNEQGVKMPPGEILQINTSRPTKQTKTQLWQPVVNQTLNGKFDFVVFLVPNGNEILYSYLKNQFTVLNALISQGVRDDVIANPNKNLMVPVAGNCLKQIMAKLGYGLWKIPFTAKKLLTHPIFLNQSKQNVMMIGIDVCHESRSKFIQGQLVPGSEGSSTVGFVASYNQDFNAYHSFVSFQPKKTEKIQKAKELMKKSLEYYKLKNRVYPLNIIIYRDGVGDNQLQTFVRIELKDFDLAIDELKLNPKPKITVVVVQKRVNLRLFEECPKYQKQLGKCFHKDCSGHEKYHSPQSGTVVDSKITNPLYSEFYLVPSNAPRGATANPTRFICVRDDIDFSSDDLQVLTNMLCSLYFNWMGPIRVPAACQYAHKIAYLFGVNVAGMPNERLNGKLYYL